VDDIQFAVATAAGGDPIPLDPAATNNRTVIAYRDNAVVDDDVLGAEADGLARRLADGPRFAYAATKSLLSRELDMDLAGSLELEAFTQALLMTTEDHAEFYRAFQEGRHPNWRGR
jgi:enoyl-CoA hydratase/carnithine racemase